MPIWIACGVLSLTNYTGTTHVPWAWIVAAAMVPFVLDWLLRTAHRKFVER